MTKKKFYEEISEQVNDTLETLMEAHPELEGAVVVLVYAEELSEVPSVSLVTNDPRDPMLLSRMGVKLAGGLNMVAKAIGTLMWRASLMGSKETKEENDRGPTAPSAVQAQGSSDQRVGHIGRPVEPS
jgi:hypothetical protein